MYRFFTICNRDLDFLMFCNLSTILALVLNVFSTKINGDDFFAFMFVRFFLQYFNTIRQVCIQVPSMVFWIIYNEISVCERLAN